MTSEVILNTRVSIAPEDLTKDVKELIRNNLNSRIQKFNSREKGSVVKILNIENFNDRVPGSGIVSLNVSFKALAFLPVKGREINCIVERILEVGVVGQFCDVKIWIHSDALGGYKWSNGTFWKENESLAINDQIRVNIMTIRYEKKVFSCIGSLVTTS